MKKKYWFIWKEDDGVQLRYEAVREVLGGSNISQVCEKYNWSKEKYHYWRKRYEDYGMLGLFEIPEYGKITPDTIRRAIVLKKSTDMCVPEITKFASSLDCVELSETSIREIISKYENKDIDELYKDKELKLKEGLKKALDNAKKGVYTAGPKTEDKIQKSYELIREIWVTENPRIQEICDKHGFDRRTFLVYQHKFEKYGMLGLVNKPAGQKGPRKTKLGIEVEIVKQKLKDRTKSAQKIADKLDADVDRQTVWSVLKKYKLNKREQKEESVIKKEVSVPIKETPDDVRAEEDFLDRIKYMEKEKIPTAYPGLFILAVFLNMLKIDKLLASMDMDKNKGGEMFRLVLLNINRIFAGIPVIGRLKHVVDVGLPLSCGMSTFTANTTLHENKFRATPNIMKYLRIELGKTARQSGAFVGKKLAIDPHLILYYGKKFKEIIGKAFDTKSKSVKRGFRPSVIWNVEINSLVDCIPHNGDEHGSKYVVNDVEAEMMPIMEEFLFCWDDTPGKDSKRLLKFLSETLEMQWINNAKIEKNKGGKIITITNEKESIRFRLDESKGKVIREMGDGDVYKYILKRENSRLNIYVEVKPEVLLLDREFTSVPVIKALFYDKGIHVIEAVRKHAGVKKLLDEINKKDLWIPVDTDTDISIKPIDIGENVYLIAKRDKQRNKIWCFETTITEESKDIIETEQQKKKSLLEVDILEYYRFRWSVENGLIDLVDDYYLDKVPTAKPGGQDFHYWCVTAAYFAVRLCKKYAGYLFSMNSQYKQYLKKSEIDEQLKMPFMAKNIRLSNDAKIFKRGEKNWYITDRLKIYKIEDTGEQLKVYNTSILGGERLSVLREVFIRGPLAYFHLDGNTLVLSMSHLKDEKAQTALVNMFKHLKEKKLNGPIDWLGGLYIDIEFTENNKHFMDKT